MPSAAREAAPYDQVEFVPMSDAQQLLWFLDVLNPGAGLGPSFVGSRGYLVTGPLDLEALEGALNDTIARHDALRTVFEWTDGIPYQVVHPVATASLHIERIEGSLEPGAAASAFLEAAEQRPRSVAVPPLIWAAVGQLGPDQHALSLIIHHAVCDAWSFGVVINDLVEAYGRRVLGDFDRPTPPLQHSTLARLQQARSDPRVEADLDHWEDRLTGLHLTALAADRPRPAEGTTGKRVEVIDLSDSLVAACTEMARSARASLFMVLLTAYQLLLHDQLGVDDITVPTLTFGRDDADVQVAVGFIANVVLLRTSLAGDPTMLELLERARATCLDAYAHEVPIIRVVDRVPDAALLMCDEEAVLTPFQFFPDLGRDVVRPLGPRCTLAPHPFTSRASALPLDARLTATARGTVVTVEFEYEISRFEAETARWVLQRYVTAVEAVASGAGTRLSGVRL